MRTRYLVTPTLLQSETCLVTKKAENNHSDGEMNVFQQEAQTFNCADTRRPKYSNFR